MIASKHLDDGLLFDCVRGDAPADAQAHVALCPSCAKKVAGFAAVLDAARSSDDEESSPFAQARARRRLTDALVEDRRASLHMWRPRTVFVAVVVATFGGAGLAAVSSERVSRAFSRFVESNDSDSVDGARGGDRRAERGPFEDIAPSAPRTPSAAEAANEAASPTDRTLQTAPTFDAPRPAPPLSDAFAPGAQTSRSHPNARSSSSTRPTSRRVALAPGALSPLDAYRRAAADLSGAASGDARFVDVGDLAAMAGEPRAALESYVRALAGDRGELADERLDRLVADGAVAEADVLAALEADPVAKESAEGMKRRCATELRHRGDRAAVALCQRFGELHRDHPAVRRLALAAGRTAEFRLDDPALAVLEYSRAILVSEIAGVASTEALLARARAQAKLGAFAAAKADLGLYLHVQPEARYREEVRALADLLGNDLDSP